MKNACECIGEPRSKSQVASPDSVTYSEVSAEYRSFSINKTTHGRTHTPDGCFGGYSSQKKKHTHTRRRSKAVRCMSWMLHTPTGADTKINKNKTKGQNVERSKRRKVKTSNGQKVERSKVRKVNRSKGQKAKSLTARIYKVQLHTRQRKRRKRKKEKRTRRDTPNEQSVTYQSSIFCVRSDASTMRETNSRY